MKLKELTDIAAVRDYLNRIGAETRSLKSAVVRQASGRYWQDIAIIRITKDGAVDCSVVEFEPTEKERADIIEGAADFEWPEPKLLHSIINPPSLLKEAPKDKVFEFRNEFGQIVMVQVRTGEGADKKYIPLTYFDDDQWRFCEPDGPLPLYGIETLKDHTTVFVHEGAKAAAHVQWMVAGETATARKALADCPWGQELSGAAHVGWIGGALSPHRTDWAILKRLGITRAYIVADNDAPGKAATPQISQNLRIPTFAIQFTDEFPKSFDLADKFPEDMFGKAGGAEPIFTGPSFRDCLHPATWATDTWVGPAGGRPTYILRDAFKGMWAYIEEADVFVCTEMPEIMRSEAVLNKMLSSFSHVNETCRLIVKAYQGRSARICYRPDHSGLMVTFKGSSAINLHVPTTIKSKVGDPTPFLEFMNYLFVNAAERKDALRWCATLIAKPEVRMSYGMLLISERQGIGKTTLGASILGPLVGVQNVSYPGENDITSSFNDWVANKRLAIVSEIYSGSSWKAYHALKAVITDKDISVNRKYMRQYEIENWCHVLASSNSMRALKMENDDRRWFYPEMTEVPWARAKFDALRRWINGGGLSIIKYWAESYGDYVTQSERAPMTDRKREMIEGSRSEAQTEAAAIAETLKEIGRPAGVLIKDVIGFIRQGVQGRVYDSDYEIRKAMQDVGLTVYPKRVKVSGRLQYILINDDLLDMVQRDEENSMVAVREHIVQCQDIMNSEM